MRLYLNGTSENNIGYTPDWVKFSFVENNQQLELTLDIHGEIEYDAESLDCRCKGDLVPWVLFNCDSGEEVDLYELEDSKIEEMFPITRIAELLHIGTDFIVGIYPTNDTQEIMELANNDVLTDCIGTCELYDGQAEYKIHFKFETEFYG